MLRILGGKEEDLSDSWVCVSCGFGRKIGFVTELVGGSDINKKQLSVWIIQELSITESSFLFS